MIGEFVEIECAADLTGAAELLCQHRAPTDGNWGAAAAALG